MNGENTQAKLVELHVHANTGIMDGGAFVSDMNRSRSGRRYSLPATPLVAFDVLATGYGQDIIEIGAVRYENGMEVAEYSIFVNPDREVPQEELEGSGISPSMLAAAPRLADVIPAFDSFLGNAILATHSDSYNMWMLNKAYEKVTDALINLTIDTLPYSQRLFDVLRRRYPYPDYLMNDFMTPSVEPYRAVESARLCGGEILHAFEIME